MEENITAEVNEDDSASSQPIAPTNLEQTPPPANTSRTKSILWLVLGIIALTALVALGITFLSSQKKTLTEVADKGSSVRIGLSIGDLREERWQRDRDLFVEAANQAGAFVQVTSANSDADLQNTQVANLISQGVDVLVIAPYDSEKISETIDLAHQAGIKVIAYDRLILNSDLDFYISFDNVEVGRLEALGVTAVKNTGNFAYIGGAPTDNNATLLKQGSMSVLTPLIEDGSINLVVDEFMTDWKPEEAYKTIKAYLAKGGKLDAVVAANDGTAFGAIRALKEYKLDGIVPVSGQDAELAACQRIIEGTQTMTVYKPIHSLANKAVEIAIALANDEQVESNDTTHNGKVSVSSYFLEPIVVTKENMDETVIKDGFHTKGQVYQTNN